MFVLHYLFYYCRNHFKKLPADGQEILINELSRKEICVCVCGSVSLSTSVPQHSSCQQ